MRYDKTQNRQYVKSAFTMIELVFLIVILGILAGIAVPKMAANHNDARIATAKQDLEQSADTIYQYLLSYGTMNELDDALRISETLWSISSDRLMMRSKITATGFNDGGFPCANLAYRKNSTGDDEKVEFTVYGDNSTAAYGANCRALRRLFSMDSAGGYGEDFHYEKRFSKGMSIK